MKLNKIFFSPTNTTKKILDRITDGISATEVREFNLEYKIHNKIFIESGITLFGLPVVEEKIPTWAVEQLNNFHAEKQLCIVVVSYGTENYKTSLNNLKDQVIRQGFIPFAEAAFLGKKNLSDKQIDEDDNVPDKADLDACLKFGNNIKHKLDSDLKIIEEVLNFSLIKEKK